MADTENPTHKMKDLVNWMLLIHFNLYSPKDTIKKVKRQAPDGEKMFVTHTPDKDSGYVNDPYKSIKMTNNLI